MEYKNFVTRLNDFEKEIAQAIYGLLTESGNNTSAGLELNDTTPVKAQNDFNWGEDGVINMEATSVRATDNNGTIRIEVVDDSVNDPDTSDDWIGVNDIESLNALYQEVYQTLNFE